MWDAYRRQTRQGHSPNKHFVFGEGPVGACPAPQGERLIGQAFLLVQRAGFPGFWFLFTDFPHFFFPAKAFCRLMGRAQIKRARSILNVLARFPLGLARRSWRANSTCSLDLNVLARAKAQIKRARSI